MENFKNTYKSPIIKNIAIYLFFVALSFSVLYFLLNATLNALIIDRAKNAKTLETFIFYLVIVYSLIMGILMTIPIVSVYNKEIKKHFIPYDPITKELQHFPHKVKDSSGKKIHPIWKVSNEPKTLTLKITFNKQLTKNVYCLVDTTSGHEYFIILSDLEKILPNMDDFIVTDTFDVINVMNYFYIKKAS